MSRRVAIALTAFGALLCGGALAVQFTTVETWIALHLLGEVAEDQVFLTIGVFRFWNHLVVVPASTLVSLCAAVALGALPWPEPVQRWGRSVIIAISTYLSVAVLMQAIPWILMVPFVASAHMVQVGTAALRVIQPSRLDVLLRTSLSHLACYTLTILVIGLGYIPDRIIGLGVERIAEGNYHGLEIDRPHQRLLATDLDANRLDVRDLANPAALMQPQQTFPTEELENLSLNNDRGEFYHFDRGTNRLRAYSLRDWSLLRESAAELQGQGTAQVSHDNTSGTVLVVRESDEACLFDMNSLTLLHRDEQVGLGNADLLFSQLLQRYVLTYYDGLPLIRTFDPLLRRYDTFPASSFQNDVQESLRRRELYVTLPVESAVLAYAEGDLTQRPRTMPTVFGVRGMVYDEVHDLVLAASMVNGYLDVIDAGSGRRVHRVFVGYYLRELQVDPARRQVFITSPLGGLYRARY